MQLAIGLGILAGVIGSGLTLLTQFILNWPAIYNRLGDVWYVLPLAFGLLGALGHFIATRRNRRALVDPAAHAFEDLFEGYYFGFYKVGSGTWLVRSMVSFLNSLFGGVFGSHGAITELQIATMPFLTRYKRFFLQEKRIFFSAALASSLSVSFGAPLSAALMAVELFQMHESKPRSAAVIAALTSSGTIVLINHFIISRIGIFNAADSISPLSILLTGPWHLNLSEISILEWFGLSFAAIVVGLLAVLFSQATLYFFSRTQNALRRAFGRKPVWIMLVSGLCMSAVVFFNPDSFQESSRHWDDIAWLRLSSASALHLLTSKWVLFLFAFAAWGSTGLLTPIFSMGLLLGYGLGNLATSEWALPLAMAAGATTLFVTFRIPMAAIALVFEIGAAGFTGGQWGLIWWISALAIATAALTVRILKLSSLQERLLEDRGIRVVNGTVSSVLRPLHVGEALNDAVVKIEIGCGLKEFCEKIERTRLPFIAVTDRSGKYLGSVILEQLPRRIRRLLRRPNVMTPEFEREFDAVDRVFDIKEILDSQRFRPHELRPSDTLDGALGHFSDFPCVAVVEADGQFRGMLFESEVHERYRQEISRQVIQSV